MKLQPGTDKKTQAPTYNPGKLPPGAPGPAAVIPVMKKAPSPFGDRQNVSPITAPPRAGGITGGLIEQAAKQKTMNQGDYSPSQQAQMQGSLRPQLPQTRPGAPGPGGGPPVAQLPQMGAAPALDPMKQAAALKFASHGAAPGAGTTPFFLTGGGQGQDPNAAKAQGGGPGLPGVPWMGGAGTPGAPGAGPAQNQNDYSHETNPNPIPVQPLVDPNKLPDEGNFGTEGETEEMGAPFFKGPDYKKDPYPGPTDPGGLIPANAPNEGVLTDVNPEDDDEYNGTPPNQAHLDKMAEEAKKAKKAEEDKWKGGDAENWWEQWLKGSIQGEKWGPGPEWVKQQGDAIALDAEKQAAADKMKSQSMYGAAGLGGSGMAVGGMGQIDSAKNAAVTSAKADLAGQQAKLGIQDKIAQLGTQMALAKQKGDVALQEKLATDLLDFQKQAQLIDYLENAPEKAMQYLGADKFASPEEYQKFWKDYVDAFKSGDVGKMAEIVSSLSIANGKATYGPAGSAGTAAAPAAWPDGVPGPPKFWFQNGHTVEEWLAMSPEERMLADPGTGGGW